MMTWEASAFGISKSPHLTWLVTMLGVSPASRCWRVAPQHMIGVRPWAIAEDTLRLTPWSVSPKSCLRSECPMITYWTPKSRSIVGETSPVYAPDSSQCMGGVGGIHRRGLAHDASCLLY